MRWLAAAGLLALLLTVPVSAGGIADISKEVEDKIGAALDYGVCFVYVVLWFIVGPLAVLMMVWLSIQYVGSREDPKRRQHVKEMMEGTLMALILIVGVVPLVAGLTGFNLKQNCILNFGGKGFDIAIEIVNVIRNIVCIIVQAFVDIAGALAALVFVSAGVKYILARNSAEDRKKARDTMMHAIIGLILLAISQPLVLSISEDLIGCS